MAQLVRHDELRVRVYKRGGWEQETSRHTPSTVATELSLSAMELQDMMLRAGLTDLFVVSDTITTDPANVTGIYPTTNGYYQVVGVDIQTGSSRFSLVRAMEGERPALLDTNAQWSGRPLYYRTVGTGSIELLPTPTGVYTVTVRLILPQNKLVSDDDTLDGLNGLEEWVVCDVVRKLAASEKDWGTVQAMDAMCARLEARVATMARMRDRASNKRVVDVRGNRLVRSRRF